MTIYFNILIIIPFIFVFVIIKRIYFLILIFIIIVITSITITIITSIIIYITSIIFSFQLDTLIQEHIPDLYVHFQSQVTLQCWRTILILMTISTMMSMMMQTPI